MKAIHMEQKYQEADNILTFNHVLEFRMGPKDVRAKGVFSTVFGSSMLDWDLQIHKQFVGRTLNIRDSSWVINLIGTGARDLYPPIRKLSFKVNVLDVDGNSTKTLKYFIDGQTLVAPQNNMNPRRMRFDQKTYSTDINSQFERSLSAVMAESKRKEMTIQLETRIEFKKTDFVDDKFLLGEGAPFVPEKLEYYFDALTNKSRHNLKLKISDGSNFVMTNKEILCLASSYFRQHLKEETTEYVVARADSIQSIDICLTYLVTGRYKRPVEMTPRLASEVYNLAIQWKVFEPKVFKNSIERHCYQELCKNREDLLYVCGLLIVADDSQFLNVHNCCIATIKYFHFNDFMRIIVNGNHPMKERFVQRREFLRPSLTMQVKRAFASSNETRNYVKYLPALGED